MNRRFSKFVIVLALISLLQTMLPLPGALAAEKKGINNRAESSGSSIDFAEQRKQQLAEDFQWSGQRIQSVLDQGYTLDELDAALHQSVENGADLEDALEQVKPAPINSSATATSQITSEWGTRDFSEPAVSSTADAPVPSYSYVNTNPAEAPYSINMGAENISTVTGGLSLQVNELTLPGRNGLSFTLTRTYDSGSSQLGKMDIAYPGFNAVSQAYEEKLYPIGRGWSWNIASIEFVPNNRYLHMANGSTYKIDSNNKLVGYPWKDLTFANTNVTVNGQTAAYVLTSLQHVSQYFNAQGQLLQIADAYNNTINFTYTTDAYYGMVLSAITDAIGNTISIRYNVGGVLLTNGTQSVKYLKVQQNGKELLSQVIDAVGRVTTYDYAIKNAQFNLLTNTPYTSNPYALLTGITHPTGAKSVFTYESSPVTRYVGPSAVNQVYRVAAREDQFTRADGSVNSSGHKDFTYTGDVGSNWGTFLSTFGITISDGLTTTVITNKRQFIDNDTPPNLYNITATTTSMQNGITYTNATTFTYDEVKNYPSPIATQVVQAASNQSGTNVSTTSASYDDYGNPTSSTNALGVMITNTYDATTHLLTGTSAPLYAGQIAYTEYVRDTAHGNVTAVRVREGSASGAIVQETLYENFDSFGHPLQTRVKKDASSYLTFQTEYQAAAPYASAFPTKQTIGVKDADGIASTIIKQYDYDTLSGRLKSYTDGLGQVTSYQYDAIGRVTQAMHPDNSTIRMAYADQENEIRQTDETGVQAVTRWNPLGWKTEAGFLENGIYKAKAKWGYDAYGRTLWSEDALGNRTTYGYDQWSRQTLVTHPDLSATTQLYDDISSGISVVDAEGNGVTKHLDKAGRVLSQDETKRIGAGPQTQTTTTGIFTYDNAGHVRTAKDGMSPTNTTTYSYDTLGRLTGVLNAQNELTSYEYDMLGNVTKTTFPDGAAKQTMYDAIGRVIQTTDAGGNLEKLYDDANNQLVRMIDNNGSRFKLTYNNRGFLLKKELADAAWTALPGDETVSFTYDLAGRRTGMTDQTGTTAYAYDPANGALQSVTFPDGRVIRYDYDAAGNRTDMKDPFDQSTYYHYDALNRLDAVSSSIDFANDYQAKYTYYKNSALKQIAQGNGVTSTYVYDGLRLGSLVEKKADGTTLNAFGYTYDNNGNQLTKTENGAASNFTYDPLNRITGSTQFNETYAYDNRGNRTSMTSNSTDSASHIYSYDRLNRLTTVAKEEEVSVNYRYNGDGLLWERTEGGQTTRYYWDGDQLIGEGMVSWQVADSASASMQYSGSWATQTEPTDYNGTMSYSGTAGDRAQLTFTGTSVQVAVRKGLACGKATILIDGAVVATDLDTFSNSTGRQRQAVIFARDGLASGTHTIQVVVKGTQNVAAIGPNVMLDYIAYGDGTTTMKARYIQGQGLIAREDAQSSKTYYLYNGHGDVVNLMDSTGTTKLNAYAYDIWGNIVTQKESIAQPFKYSGEFWDNTSSLQYLRARWYDPSMGRFIHEDTYEGQIDNPLTLNLYTYVGNNPLMYTDPSGHKWWRAVSGALDSTANFVTFGLYGDIMEKIDTAAGRVQEDPDYYAGASWGYSTFETASAFAAAWAARSAGVGGATCFATEGAGCVVAGSSAGIMVLAGYQGTYNSMMSDNSSDLYQYYKSNGKPYSDPTNRPKYGKGQIEDVWENAKDADGRVFDKNTGEELFWDKSKSRAGQWDMGHKPEYKYSEWHKKYMDGDIDYDTFMREYRNPNNYRPESVSANRSHKYE